MGGCCIKTSPHSLQNPWQGADDAEAPQGPSLSSQLGVIQTLGVCLSGRPSAPAVCLTGGRDGWSSGKVLQGGHPRPWSGNPQRRIKK